MLVAGRVVASAAYESHTKHYEHSQADEGFSQTWNSEESKGQRFRCEKADYNRAGIERLAGMPVSLTLARACKNSIDLVFSMQWLLT